MPHGIRSISPCSTADRSTTIATCEDNILVHQNVEPVARANFQSGLDIQVAHDCLFRDLSERLSERAAGSIFSTILCTQHGSDRGINISVPAPISATRIAEPKVWR